MKFITFRLPLVCLGLVASGCSYAESLSDMRHKIESLEDRVDRLEDKYNRLADRLDQVKDSRDHDDDDRRSGCRAEDQVKMVEKKSFNVISEKLCPYQCAVLLQKQQKMKPEKEYVCVKQSAVIW